MKRGIKMWDLKCGDDKEKLIKYGEFVASEKKINLESRELDKVVDRILKDVIFRNTYKIEKDIYKNIVYSYVCLGSY